MKVLDRDNHRCQAVGCSAKATEVHHSRYPKHLGEERLHWLHSVCQWHHAQIHIAERQGGLKLRKATEEILGRRVGRPPRKNPRRKVKPFIPRVIETRTDVRDGREFTVLVLPDSPMSSRQRMSKRGSFAKRKRRLEAAR